MKRANIKGYRAFGAVLLFLLAFSSLTWAENVDLVTLPQRDGVQLTIYNSEDLTLVREVRTLSFKKGMNRLQFSWVNTLIDPTSIEFRPLEHKGEVEVVDTLIPGEDPTHLIWNISSEYEGQIKVLVTYFISGLTWRMDYVLTTDVSETSLDFEGHITVVNKSGEDFEDTQVRIIVGKVNLIEKIAALAAKKGIPVPKKVSKQYDQLRREALIEDIEEYEYENYGIVDDTIGALGIGAGSPTGSYGRRHGGRRRKVGKRNVSDYYIFAVDGTQTVGNKCERRMLAVAAEKVKYETVYRRRSYQYGYFPVPFVIFENDEEHKLGSCPLPFGDLRAYRKNTNGSLSFLAKRYLDYSPIKAEVEIRLDPDNRVVYESYFYDNEFGNFDFGGNEVILKVLGWTETQTYNKCVRNYSSKPIKFELREIWSGDVEYRSDIEATLFDYQTVETTFTVAPGEARTFHATAKVDLGTRKVQDSVELKK